MPHTTATARPRHPAGYQAPRRSNPAPTQAPLFAVAGLLLSVLLAILSPATSASASSAAHAYAGNRDRVAVLGEGDVPHRESGGSTRQLRGTAAASAESDAASAAPNHAGNAHDSMHDGDAYATSGTETQLRAIEMADADASALDANSGDAASRHLLHGLHLPWWPWGWPHWPLFWIPHCKRGCRLFGCVGWWWFGVCRAHWRIHICFRPKWWPHPFPWIWWLKFRALGPRPFAGPTDNALNVTFTGSGPAPQATPGNLDPARLDIDLTRDPDAAPPRGTSLFEQNLTATAPYVACMDDADCELRGVTFTPRPSSTRCSRPRLADDPSGIFVDFPGVCHCEYVTRNFSPEEPTAVLGSVNVRVIPCVQLLEGITGPDLTLAEAEETLFPPFFLPTVGPFDPPPNGSLTLPRGPAPPPIPDNFTSLQPETPKEIVPGTIVTESFVVNLPPDFEDSEDYGNYGRYADDAADVESNAETPPPATAPPPAAPPPEFESIPAPAPAPEDADDGPPAPPPVADPTTRRGASDSFEIDV